MIVIDVGCARHGGDYSIERLIDEFHPTDLYGFDPSWNGDSEWEYDGTYIKTLQVAAWTSSGTVGFLEDGLSGHVEEGAPLVPCIDLADFVAGFGDREEIVLKLDAEGAEYDLLPHLIERGLDRRLTLVWVEWHCLGCGRGGGGHRDGCRGDRGAAARRAGIEERILCELAEWRF